MLADKTTMCNQLEDGARRLLILHDVRRVLATQSASRPSAEEDTSLPASLAAFVDPPEAMRTALQRYYNRNDVTVASDFCLILSDAALAVIEGRNPGARTDDLVAAFCCLLKLVRVQANIREGCCLENCDGECGQTGTLYVLRTAGPNVGDEFGFFERESNVTSIVLSGCVATAVADAGGFTAIRSTNKVTRVVKAMNGKLIARAVRPDSLSPRESVLTPCQRSRASWAVSLRLLPLHLPRRGAALRRTCSSHLANMVSFVRRRHSLYGPRSQLRFQHLLTLWASH